ncbi:Clp protease N-terminal domain-containing protein [Nocardia transvalensis]|uniref:Clp protease N-terminal domain-containing protein n=1 Tax=Nocardia transvalensis TaxID=37333 RepID=UPI001894E48C|nr:Clp protease N-terminal domain-containing protein [Nocardia transvalensis]MBF6332895.1 hypothetical protein [Nocardia transvalensis]
MTPSNEALTVTPRAHWVLGYAEAVARERAHTGVGPEHIQLAILYNPYSIPTKVLAVTGVEPDAIADTLSAAMNSPDYHPPIEHHGTLIAAGNIARALKHEFIGVEHLQLAILGNRECLATRELERAGVHPGDFEEALRTKIRAYR